ncbi:MAG: hypothetical protein QM786_10425 [Breznakibacter sp.]
MALDQIKPQIEELNGTRCVVVESGIPEDRADFLSRLLQHNGYKVETASDAQGLCSVGVADLLFNPVLDVYKRRLRSFSNHRVTPAYWLQQSSEESIDEVEYWTRR